MVKRYVDFELHVTEIDNQQISIDINGRPYAINLLKPVNVTLQSKPLNWENLSIDPKPDVASAGHSLYRSVFIQDVESRFQAYLNRRKYEEGVRICVCAQSGELSEAIWETLCNEPDLQDSFLALDPRTPVVRIPRIGKEVYLRKISIPLRILVVLSSPRRIPKISAEEERAALEQALGGLVTQGTLEVDYLGFDNSTEANFDKLQTYLAGQDYPYDIVHIIGHGLLEAGQQGVIALTNPIDGKRQDVSASSLAKLFQSRGVMFVILQSCESGAVDANTLYFAGVAQQLVASGVPAVLAMQEVIDQDVARYFIAKLYTHWLSDRCLLEDALTQARQNVYQVFSERAAAWAIPVLYICPGVQLELSKLSLLKQKLKERATSAKTQVRLAEAALPDKIRLGQETELLVLIRTPANEGLHDILETQWADYDADPDNVRTSGKFNLIFPVDKVSGKLIHRNVMITIETNDFELSENYVEVQVRPQGDSTLYVFYLIPNKSGKARLRVKIIDIPVFTILACISLKSQVFEQYDQIGQSEYHSNKNTRLSRLFDKGIPEEPEFQDSAWLGEKMYYDERRSRVGILFIGIIFGIILIIIFALVLSNFI